MYSNVGRLRLFIKAQKRQVVEGLNMQMTINGKQLMCLMKNKICWVTSRVVALVVAAGVIREKGITVDKVMDLLFEREFSKVRRH